jgi:hypothetical protein
MRALHFMKIGYRLLAFLAVLTLASRSQAVLVTFNYTLQVISSTVQTPGLITGSIVVESATPDSAPSDSSLGQYFGAVRSISSSLNVSIVPQQDNYVFVESNAYRFDQYFSSLQILASGSSLPGFFYMTINFGATDFPNSVVLTDALTFQPPISFPFLVQTSFVQLQYFDGPQFVSVLATVRDFSAVSPPIASVPEAGSSSLMLSLAVLAIVALRRRT